MKHADEPVVAENSAGHETKDGAAHHDEGHGHSTKKRPILGPTSVQDIAQTVIGLVNFIGSLFLLTKYPPVMQVLDIVMAPSVVALCALQILEYSKSEGNNSEAFITMVILSTYLGWGKGVLTSEVAGTMLMVGFLYVFIFNLAFDRGDQGHHDQHAEQGAPKPAHPA